MPRITSIDTLCSWPFLAVALGAGLGFPQARAQSLGQTLEATNLIWTTSGTGSSFVDR